MIFEWFFGNKETKEQLFKEFKDDLNDLKIIDESIEFLLDDSGLNNNENNIRAIVKRKSSLLFVQLEKFEKLLLDQNKILQEYIDTSIQAIDYLSKIKSFVDDILSNLNTIESNIGKSGDLLVILDECNSSLGRIKEDIIFLEESMRRFKEQSKESLEWNYESGANNIEECELLKLVKDLGGVVVSGKGSHFQVKFKGFNHVLSPSQKNVKEIAKGTINAFCNHAESVYGGRLNIKYLKCYFFKPNSLFRRLFVAKYRKFFAI